MEAIAIGLEAIAVRPSLRAGVVVFPVFPAISRLGHCAM